MAADIIDVHAHPIPDFLRDALLAAGRSPALSRFPDWNESLALATMDNFGIARSILSISTPGVHYGDDGAARVLARRCNEFFASLREKNDGRFGGFAAMPLPDVDGACAEAIHALDTLGLDGVGLLASYEGIFLGHPKFDPLMQELDRRAAVVFVHPAGHPSSWNLAIDYPVWMLEYPIDTTRAAVNLVMSGTLGRYPNIRFILAHNGGALPYLAWRLAAAPVIDPRYADRSEEALRAGFRKFYYESAQSPGDEAYASLLRVADADHLLFGSDWPYCRAEVVEAMISTLKTAETISPELLRSIQVQNASRLLPRR